jgi:hypothetical protein
MTRLTRIGIEIRLRRTDTSPVDQGHACHTKITAHHVCAFHASDTTGYASFAIEEFVRLAFDAPFFTEQVTLLAGVTAARIAALCAVLGAALTLILIFKFEMGSKTDAAPCI